MTKLTKLGTPHPLRLLARHLDDARLYATRKHQIWGLVQRGLLKPGGSVMEVGVAYGDFSIHLINELSPSRFVGIDIFKMHELDMEDALGKPLQEVMAGKTHREYYEQRLNAECAGPEIIVREGNSNDEMDKFEPESFDLIYIDALHTFPETLYDTAAAARLCRPGGVIIFNDYVMMNYKNRKAYGVVQAANQLIVESGFKVVGFALAPEMFCDLAVVKP